jgi:hypothetical protein
MEPTEKAELSGRKETQRTQAKRRINHKEHKGHIAEEAIESGRNWLQRSAEGAK